MSISTSLADRRYLEEEADGALVDFQRERNSGNDYFMSCALGKSASRLPHGDI